MDQVYLMKVFVSVGELESFAAASRRLDISPAAVTRAVATLEHLLGARLLHRTSRNVRLTEAGARYLDDCRTILASIVEANQAAAGASLQPRGDLSVTAPTLFGKSFVLPSILRFLHTYPDVNVSAFFHDRVVNLAEEDIDIAVRIGQLRDSGLKALHVGTVRKMVCASPQYLSKHGVPRHPQDLVQHAVIAANGVSPWVDFRLGYTSNAPAMLRIKPRLTVTNNDTAIVAAIAGIGIAQLHSYQATDEIASGQLQVLLEVFEEEPKPVHILHRENKYASAKLRAFVDMLALDLRERLHTSSAES